MERALSSDPDASTTAPIRPTIMSEVFGGPNSSASSVSGAAKPREDQRADATSEERTQASGGEGRACPALCDAIWYPSITLTTDEDSPGRLTRMAVVEPPYWAP